MHKKLSASTVIACAFMLQTVHAFAAATIGVGTHFGQGRNERITSELLAKSNFDSIRDEIYWGDVEKTRGTYQLDGRAKSSATNLLKFRNGNAAPMVILSYGNRLYDNGDQPGTNEARAAFAKYADFIANKFSGTDTYFEVWNEWNLGSGTRPARKPGSPADYVSLVKSVREKLGDSRPNSQLIAGALGDDLGNWPWLTSAIGYGLLKYCDGISVHLYNYSNPPSKGGNEDEFINRLHSLNELLKRSNGGTTVPIHITEIGWPNHTGAGGVETGTAAALAARFLLRLDEVPFVKSVWLYELIDGSTNINDRESNFGLFTPSGEEKPVYCAVKNVRELLNSGAQESTKKKSTVFSRTFKKPGSQDITAIWRTDWNKQLDTKSHSIQISEDSEVLLLSSCSEGYKKYPAKSEIEITESPILIKHRAGMALEIKSKFGWK